MASAVARAYNKGLGRSPQRGPRVEFLVEGQGAKPPEAKALLVLGHLINAANLPTFLKFGNAKKSDICVIFAKNHGRPRNWGEAKAKSPPRPGPKTATDSGP